MLLRVQNLFTTVAECTEPEAAWLAHFASYCEKARQEHEDGTWYTTHERFSLLSSENVLGSSLPTGLIPVVIRAARDRGIAVQIDDRRKAPCEPEPNADLRWLRPDQLAAVNAIAKKGRGLLDIGTAGGKGDLAVGLVRLLPCRWLLLVNASSLAVQAAERFNRKNREHGVSLPEAGLITDGVWTAGERLTCATYQSLAAGLRRQDPRARAVLFSAGGLIIDEVHFVGSPSAYYVAMHTPRAYFRVGASATPLDRSDNRNVLVVAATGPVVYRVPASELMAMGVVSRPTVKMTVVRHPPEEEDQQKRPWLESYAERVVVSKERNLKVLERVMQSAKPALVCVTALRHGVALRRALTARGLRTDFVWGKRRPLDRADVYRRLDAGELDVVVGNVVVNQGIDIPNLRSVIVAAAGRSTIATLQRLGRGMRKTSEKDVFTVYDFDDRGTRWLERQTVRRIAAYQREGFEVSYEEVNASTDD